MRHGKKINHLSRKTAHRSAMLSNMACSLIEHKRINTTLAKAKALRKYVEPLITKSKEDTTHNRRVLFRDVAPKINNRPGGYTRIIKLNNRLGDNAEMAMIELVDFNELLTKDKTTKKKSRRRGGKKSSNATTKVSENIEEAVIVEETPPEVEEVKSEKPEVNQAVDSEEKPPSKDDSNNDDVKPEED